jgi:hypothetical protein
MKTNTLVVYRRLPAIVLLLATTALGLGAGDVVPREVTAGFPGPKPGEVFREYVWTKAGDSGFLRVGGRLGYGGGPVMWPHDFDLTHPTRAEVVLEKLLSAPRFDKNVSWKRRLIKTGGKNQHHDHVFGDFLGTGKPQLAFWNQRAATLFLAHIPADPHTADAWQLTPLT